MTKEIDPNEEADADVNLDDIDERELDHIYNLE